MAFPILYSLQTPERFSGVSRGYKTGTAVNYCWTGLYLRYLKASWPLVSILCSKNIDIYNFRIITKIIIYNISVIEKYFSK